MNVETDVDIDFFDRDRILLNLSHVRAKLQDSDKVHPSGIYFQPVPKDPLTNISTIGYKDAAKLGFFKIDFLNNHAYDNVRDEAHLYELIEREPLWEMLEEPEITGQLFHIGRYQKLTALMRPRSIEQLAMLLAIIRPGKSHLQYKPWAEVEKTVWDKGSDGEYIFKKAHGISYAVVIVMQMNLLAEQASSP